MDKLAFPEVMVDIETTGTQPNKSAIIQICAIKFNIEDRTVCSDVFNRSLKVPGHRSWDLDTYKWWTKDKSELLQRIIMAGEDPKIVLNDMFEWADPVMGQMRFWAKPTSFDFTFVQSYFKDFDVPFPFDFRTAVDMRSFLRGVHYPNEFDNRDEPPFVGEVHNALYDTLHQIKTVFYHLEKVDAVRRDNELNVLDYATYS